MIRRFDLRRLSSDLACTSKSGTSRLETSIGGMGGKGGGKKARAASPPKVVVSHRPRRLWRLGWGILVKGDFR